MRKTGFWLLLVATTSHQALALNVPTAAGEDPHVRVVAYSPYNRVRLVIGLGRATMITFGPTENVMRMTFPNDPIVQVPKEDEVKQAPLKNTLPLWPMKSGENNAIVTTVLPDGSYRIYQFDLVVHAARPEGDEDPEAVFGLIYTYPRDAKAAAVAEWKVRKASMEEQTATDRLSTDFFYGERNWKYAAQGKANWLAPSEVSDNGRLTAFRWPGNRPIPSIYTVNRSGEEQMLTPRMQDDLQIVSTVACHFRLRSGQAVVEVYNKGNCEGYGYNPGTGTTSPDVVRELKSATR